MKSLKYLFVLSAILLSLSGCGQEKAAESLPSASSGNSAAAQSIEKSADSSTETPAPPAETEKSESDESASSASEGIRPEFKEMMDEYEEFYDSYVDILKKMQSNPSDMAVLSNYAKLMEQYQTVNQKLEEVDQSSLSSEELQYYIDVTSRIQKKLVSVSGGP